MNILQKFLSHLLIVIILATQVFSPLFAEEDFAVHSLDELPSSQIGTDDTPSAIQSEEKTLKYEASPVNEDVMTLIAAKQSFEAEQKKAIIEVPSIASLLEQNTSLWGMSQSSIADGFLSPIKEITTKTFFPALDFGSTQSKDVFAHSKEKSFHVPKEAKLGESTHGKFAKNPTQVKLVPETIITAADGTLIDPATIGLYEADTAIMSKANSYHDKKMKKKGTKAKGYATSDANTFDFGIPGKHLIFSKPVEISLYTPNFMDGIVLDIAALHAGDADFNTSGLSIDGTTGCNPDGTATIPGSSVTVKNGKVTFYTCGASSFTMNPSGGTAGSNDIRAVIGDCGQIQIYYNNLMQIYTGNPPATGCSAGGTMDAWPVLRIGATSYGNDFTAWSTNSTTGSTVGNTYTATSTMTRVVGGLTYTLIIDWSYTAPNKYITWSWRMTIPPTNTQNVRFYYGMDSYVAGGDTNDVGYLSSTGGLTFGVYDSVANVLSAFRYMSGQTWTAYEAGPLATVRGRISGGTNFANTITASTDLGYGVNWDFGTTPGTYSGTLQWTLAPYVSANVPDLVPGIGQPEGPLTTGFVSQMPITVSNVGNLASSGVHTAVLTIPANITGPASAFSDNGWSCGAQVGTTVTCTKTTTIAPLADDTFRIPVIPQPAAGGTNVTFNLAISNPGDSNTTNNTAFATNAVVAAAPAIAPGGVGAGLWLKADGGKNCNTLGCTISAWSNSGTLGAAANAVTGLGTVTYTPNVQINFNPTIYFNNASLNTNNNLGLPTRANSIFVVSRVSAGGAFYMGTQTVTNNTRSWRTSPTTDQWMRYNSTIFYNGANGRSADTPAITSTIRQAAGASAGYTNGRSLLTSASTLTFTVNNFGIGRVGNTNSTLSNVAEVVIYNSAITAANQNRVESYLALKYGITLDQTTAKNYIFSNGTTTSWNASLAGTYNRDIAGVIRDDLTGLNQLKSQSINNAGDIIVETAGAIGSNSRALIWANNGSATGTFTTTDVPAIYQRIDREWQFQEKNGDVGNVKISYPAASLPGGATSPIYMLVDDDGVFAAGATAYTGTLVGGNWEFTTNLSDMQYITFAQDGDVTPPTITSINIASGTLIPHGNFSLTYNYTDTGAGIDAVTATGQIYSWNAGSSSYNATPLAGYMSITSNSAASTTMDVTGLPFGRYRFDMSISDALGNTTTQSYTYFIDAIEWTVSADTYNIGDMVPLNNSFGTGELLITIRTVGAGFTLTNIATSTLITPLSDTINYWNGTIGWGYDQWSGAYSGNITSHSPSVTLANVAKNINQDGQKNTFTYRIKYGANTAADQATGDYTGTVSFGLNLTY